MAKSVQECIAMAIWAMGRWCDFLFCYLKMWDIVSELPLG